MQNSDNDMYQYLNDNFKGKENYRRGRGLFRDITDELPKPPYKTIMEMRLKVLPSESSMRRGRNAIWFNSSNDISAELSYGTAAVDGLLTENITERNLYEMARVMDLVNRRGGEIKEKFINLLKSNGASYDSKTNTITINKDSFDKFYKLVKQFYEKNKENLLEVAITAKQKLTYREPILNVKKKTLKQAKAINDSYKSNNFINPRRAYEISKFAQKNSFDAKRE